MSSLVEGTFWAVETVETETLSWGCMQIEEIVSLSSQFSEVSRAFLYITVTW
jgi:hypothetical protein